MESQRSRAITDLCHLKLNKRKELGWQMSVLMPWPLCLGSRWCLIHFRSFLKFGLITVGWAIHFCFLGTRLCRSLSIRSRSQYSLSLVNLLWASVRTEWLTLGTADAVWSGAQFTGSVMIYGVAGGMEEAACSWCQLLPLLMLELSYLSVFPYLPLWSCQLVELLMVEAVRMGSYPIRKWHRGRWGDQWVLLWWPRDAFTLH